MTAADTVPHRAPPTPRPDPGRLGRGWPWAVAATLLGSAAAAWPLPTLGAAAGIAVLFVAVAAPRTMVGLTVIGVLFVRPVVHLVPVDAVRNLDEALVALCAVTLPLHRLIDRKPLRAFPGQWWFAVFAAAGLLSGVVVGVEPSTLLLGAFVTCKGFIFAWAVAQVDWEERHLRAAAGVGAVVIVLCLLAVAANMAMPAAWAGIMSNDGNIEVRVGLPSALGPFTHPLDLGQVMALAFVAVLTWRSAVRRSALTFCLLLGTGLATLLTFRRSAITSLAAAALWVKAKVRSVGVLVGVAAAAPVALVVLFQPLVAVVAFTYNDYIVRAATEARTVLTVDSFKVAAANFPGGAGFGRFGSAIAASRYSPEYTAPGVPAHLGVGPGAGRRELPDRHRVARAPRGDRLLRCGRLRPRSGRDLARRSPGTVGSGISGGPLDRAAGDGLDGERIDHLYRERGVHRSAIVRNVLRPRRGPHSVCRTAGSSGQSGESERWCGDVAVIGARCPASR